MVLKGKQVRQYGLRKGDLLSGLSRPANRNEKNPGFHQINTVNDLPAASGSSQLSFAVHLAKERSHNLWERESDYGRSSRVGDSTDDVLAEKDQGKHGQGGAHHDLADGLEHYLTFRRHKYKWPADLPKSGVFFGAGGWWVYRKRSFM
jgi:hypothetical protein